MVVTVKTTAAMKISATIGETALVSELTFLIMDWLGGVQWIYIVGTI